MYYKNYLTTIVLTFFFGSIFMPSLGMMKDLTRLEIIAESLLILKEKCKVEEKEVIFNALDFFRELDNLYGYERYGGDVDGTRASNIKLNILYDLHTKQQKRVRQCFSSDSMVAAFNQQAYFETLNRYDKDHEKLKREMVSVLSTVFFQKEKYEEAFHKMENHYANLEEENLLRIPENIPEDLYELHPFLSRIKEQQLVPVEEEQKPTEPKHVRKKEPPKSTSRSYKLGRYAIAATTIGITLILYFLYRRLSKSRPF